MKAQQNFSTTNKPIHICTGIIGSICCVVEAVEVRQREEEKIPKLLLTAVDIDSYYWEVNVVIIDIEDN